MLGFSVERLLAVLHPLKVRAFGMSVLFNNHGIITFAKEVTTDRESDRRTNGRTERP